MWSRISAARSLSIAPRWDSDASPADRSIREVLTALGVAERRANEVKMRIGEEEIVLVQFESAGREYPARSRSDDLWFQHLAIVVSDMDEGYSRLRSSGGWDPISTEGPETLPASSGGVRAFKFRDPDGHPLELLWLPPGVGGPYGMNGRTQPPPTSPFSESTTVRSP